MDKHSIETSYKLKYVAHFKMHLETIHANRVGSNESKQRDQYMTLITYMESAPFEYALEKYQQIALGDTDIKNFTLSDIKIAEQLARRDLGLLWPL